MKKIIWIVSLFLLFDCTKEDYQPSTEEGCRIGRYIYGQDSGRDKSYLINYVENTLTQVEIVNDQIQSGDTWVTNVTYKHFYRNDSLYVKDFTTFQDGATYITAQTNDTGIQSVITTFPANGGTFRYIFDYSKDGQITVSLDRIQGNVATFDSRGVYYLNADQNVSKLEITRNPEIHGSDADNFTARTKTYTYDIIINPLKGFVLSAFLKPELPDVNYFSFTNKLTEAYDGKTLNYKMEYGTDPMPTSAILPSGVVEKYEYFNCTN